MVYYAWQASSASRSKCSRTRKGRKNIQQEPEADSAGWVTVRKQRVQADTRAPPPNTRSKRSLPGGGDQDKNDSNKRARRNRKVNQTEVGPACTRSRIQEPPVANTVTQQQFAEEPASRASSRQQLAQSGAVVENTGQGHTVLVPAETGSPGQTRLAQPQQTGDDLSPTLSPAKDNSSPENDSYVEKGTFARLAYSFMLPCVYKPW